MSNRAFIVTLGLYMLSVSAFVPSKKLSAWAGAYSSAMTLPDAFSQIFVVFFNKAQASN
ncbi:hypothetical protein C8R44DRAFT_870961 [Mycena epipterygia]|nr:hypothetical protein C8R44DRAFT_870961 [Mycena epipterygia]